MITNDQTEPDWVISLWICIRSCFACWKWGSCGSRKLVLFTCSVGWQHNAWFSYCIMVHIAQSPVQRLKLLLPPSLPKTLLGNTKHEFLCYGCRSVRTTSTFTFISFSFSFPTYTCKSHNNKHLDKVFMLPSLSLILLFSPTLHLYSNSANIS